MPLPYSLQQVLALKDNVFTVTIRDIYSREHERHTANAIVQFTKQNTRQTKDAYVTRYENTIIFIGYMALETTEDVIKMLLARFDEIQSVYGQFVMMDYICPPVLQLERYTDKQYIGTIQYKYQENHRQNHSGFEFVSNRLKKLYGDKIETYFETHGDCLLVSFYAKEKILGLIRSNFLGMVLSGHVLHGGAIFDKPVYIYKSPETDADSNDACVYAVSNKQPIWQIASVIDGFYKSIKNEVYVDLDDFPEDGRYNDSVEIRGCGDIVALRDMFLTEDTKENIYLRDLPNNGKVLTLEIGGKKISLTPRQDSNANVFLTGSIPVGFDVALLMVKLITASKENGKGKCHRVTFEYAFKNIPSATLYWTYKFDKDGWCLPSTYISGRIVQYKPEID